MVSTKISQYGSWKSPITPDLISYGTIGFDQIALEDGNIYWIETRPAEDGRSVIVHRSPDGQIKDITPSGFNVRTRVHEYGGGAFTVVNGTVYFSNFSDQRLYRQYPGSQPEPITQKGNLRFADSTADCKRNRLICVCEDHSDAESEPFTTLVGIGLHGVEGREVLVSGNDFYSSPCLSPDGSRLAWITWNHPSMPWDGTELWIAEIKPDGSIDHSKQVAGGIHESIFQPEWSPDGILHFISDRTGWWNIYRLCNGYCQPLMEKEGEFGVPQWKFGLSTYSFESTDRIICTYVQQGTWRLASLNTSTQKVKLIEVPYSNIGHVHTMSGQVVCIAGSPTQPKSVIRLDMDSQQIEVFRHSNENSIDPAYLSIPEPVEFPTEQGLTSHAFYYPPKNRDYLATAAERPPLLVMSHGGPTSSASTAFNLTIQYWTSRGIAVLDVNYGGSTGYGRVYRQRLNGKWGIVDVNDCVNGAIHLVNLQKVDANRLAIRGGSAGGYTTLCALTFRNIFKAGASYYGISDLEKLAKETHKFESRYMDRLLGPYPERKDIYYNRSPINFADQITCPVIFFQGLDDKIVPSNQTEMIFETIRSNGIPVSFFPFIGEQHGFRIAKNIKIALDAELYFYSRIFNFELADEIDPVQIENM